MFHETLAALTTAAFWYKIGNWDCDPFLIRVRWNTMNSDEGLKIEY